MIMIRDDLSKALLNYQITNNCTIASMARMCGVSYQKMGHLMGVHHRKSYEGCDSVKIDKNLENGLKKMGIRIKIIQVG